MMHLNAESALTVLPSLDIMIKLKHIITKQSDCVLIRKHSLTDCCGFFTGEVTVEEHSGFEQVCLCHIL